MSRRNESSSWGLEGINGAAAAGVCISATDRCWADRIWAIALSSGMEGVASVGWMGVFWAISTVAASGSASAGAIGAGDSCSTASVSALSCTFGCGRISGGISGKRASGSGSSGVGR